MEIYSTEEQQEEAIKKFFKENGLQIFLGAALGLGGFMGWKSYVASQLEAQEAASVEYDKFVESATAETAQLESINTELNAFVTAHGETGYGIFANLIAAKKAAEAGDLKAAESRLVAAEKATTEPSLNALINTRLARVQTGLGNYDEALATLNAITESGFEANVAELKGDVYVAQGLADKARQAYQLAADKGGLEGNNVLKMKLQDLAQPVSTAS
ncbi:tetratricopeptide repeat protein [Psychrosphaera ytuae]|uniref:Ancillary SecYEG translocon subunit n=1 Tax=Psychrosphaera ytuae TaxID=2820710 RepID=A0A975HHY3_9GAMM|nr:tetratricopeptide repeat protein [Psychrosphaera ytuae]QTH63645.1 tetratricopeptide repeat protein [Psychrosphaera ytuae]